MARDGQAGACEVVGKPARGLTEVGAGGDERRQEGLGHAENGEHRVPRCARVLVEEPGPGGQGVLERGQAAERAPRRTREGSSQRRPSSSTPRSRRYASLATDTWGPSGSPSGPRTGRGSRWGTPRPAPRRGGRTTRRRARRRDPRVDEHPGLAHPGDAQCLDRGVGEGREPRRRGMDEPGDRGHDILGGEVGRAARACTPRRRDLLDHQLRAALVDDEQLDAGATDIHSRNEATGHRTSPNRR